MGAPQVPLFPAGQRRVQPSIHLGVSGAQGSSEHACCTVWQWGAAPEPEGEGKGSCCTESSYLLSQHVSFLSHSLPATLTAPRLPMMSPATSLTSNPATHRPQFCWSSRTDSYLEPGERQICCSISPLCLCMVSQEGEKSLEHLGTT